MEAEEQKVDILVIDDDITILQSIEKQLKNEARLNLEFVSNPLEGLKRVNEKTYQLIICDIRMKPIDGIEVLKKVKSEHHDIPIIILTGFVNDKILNDAKRFGSNAFLYKPVRKRKLIESIYSLLKVS